jgi:hypothetical protein
MSLLTDIQTAAVSSEKPVSELLRMCAVLAKRLGHKPLETWVRLELDGYPDPDRVPDYRVHPVHVVCQVVGPFGSNASDVPVPYTAFPQQHRDTVFNIKVGDGTEKLEAFAAGEQATLYMPVNPGPCLGLLGQ